MQLRNERFKGAYRLQALLKMARAVEAIKPNTQTHHVELRLRVIDDAGSIKYVLQRPITNASRKLVISRVKALYLLLSKCLVLGRITGHQVRIHTGHTQPIALQQALAKRRDVAGFETQAFHACVNIEVDVQLLFLAGMEQIAL